MPRNTLTHPVSVISSTSRTIHTGLTSFWLVPVSTIPAVRVYIFGSVLPLGRHIILPCGTHHICSYIGGRAVKLQECTDFTLDQVKGSLKLTKDVILQPFETVKVRGINKVRNHQKQVHVIVEPKETQCRTVSAIPTYSHLKPGSSKISIGL